MDATEKLSLEVEEVLLPVEEKIDEETGELGVALKELGQLIRSFGTDLEPMKADPSLFDLAYTQERAIDMASYSMAIPDGYVVESSTDKDAMAWLPNPKCVNKKDKAVVTIQFGKERLINVDGEMTSLAMGAAMQEQMYWNERSAGNAAYIDTEFFPILTSSVAGGCAYSFVNNHCKYVVGLCMDGRNQQIQIDAYGVGRSDEAVVRDMVYKLMDGVSPKRQFTPTTGIDVDSLVLDPISKDSIEKWGSVLGESVEANKLLLVKRIQVAMTKAQCQRKINAFSLSEMLVDLNKALDDTAKGVDGIFADAVSYMQKLSILNSENEDLMDVYDTTKTFVDDHKEVSISVGETRLSSQVKTYDSTIESIYTPELKVMMSEEKMQERAERERRRVEKEARLAKLRAKYPGYSDEEMVVLEYLEGRKADIEAKITSVDAEIQEVQSKIDLNNKVIEETEYSLAHNEEYRKEKLQKIQDDFVKSIQDDNSALKTLRADIKSKKNDIIKLLNESAGLGALAINKKKELQSQIEGIKGEMSKLEEDEAALMEKIENEDSKKDARIKAIDNDADNAKRKILELQQANKVYEGQKAPKEATRNGYLADISQFDTKIANVKADVAAGVYDNIIKQ
jgi:chromosome segregation ATPase